MIKNCKHCKSNNLVMNGFVAKKQRYSCKDCKKTSRPGDARVSYSKAKKAKVIKLYLQGKGVREIAHLQKVSPPMVTKWIKEFPKNISLRLKQQKIPKNVKNFEFITLNEISEYIEKNFAKSAFIVVLTEDEMKILSRK